MNDETLKEQIDEILNDLANVASGFIIVPEPRNQKDKAKQAILDWHNKQIEAVLDRLNYTLFTVSMIRLKMTLSKVKLCL